MFAFRLLQSVLFNALFFGVFIFTSAGTMHWWRGWVFVAVSAIGAGVTMLTVFRNNEELLMERMKPPVQKGQPFADKILVLLFIAGFVAVIVAAPLDAVRFHWGPMPGSLVSALGLGLFIVGWTIITLTFHANSFAAPVVKHQKERGQRVVDTGVYRFVRHPMYAGCIPLLFGLPLWLGSYYAAMLAAIPVLTLAVRIIFEERFLRRVLPGYGAYAARVRSRLIPFVW